MDKKIFIKGTVAYVNLTIPKVFIDGTKKYTIRLLIDKSDVKTKDKINSALKEIYEVNKELFKNDEQAVPPLKEIKKSINDGADFENIIYKNYLVLDAKSSVQPQVIDISKKLIDLAEVRAGSEVVLAVNFFPYSVEGNRGISCKLNSLMFIKQSSPIVAVSDATADFADFNFDEEI